MAFLRLGASTLEVDDKDERPGDDSMPLLRFDEDERVGDAKDGRGEGVKTGAETGAETGGKREAAKRAASRRDLRPAMLLRPSMYSLGFRRASTRGLRPALLFRPALYSLGLSLTG